MGSKITKYLDGSYEAPDVSDPPDPPGTPILSVTYYDDSQIDLSWTVPTGTIQGYTLQRGTDGLTYGTTLVDNVLQNTYSDTGLTASTVYYYRIYATDTDDRNSAYGGLYQTTSGGTVTLPESAVTSAGVYDASGVLVRTLWSSVSKSAGVVPVTWDGLDDDGSSVTGTGPYTAKLLAHNITYTWEGTIGNTSTELSGAGKYFGLTPIQGMAITSGDYVYVTQGYQEGMPYISKFDKLDPNTVEALFGQSSKCVWTFCDTDSTLVYFANTGTSGANHDETNFIIALDCSDDSQHNFSSGSAYTTWTSVIDKELARVDRATGLAVQRTGTTLFVAHESQDEIRLFHKTTGADLGTPIAVTAPRGLCIAPDDSLWCICTISGENAIARYAYSGSWSLAASNNSDVTTPLAIGCDSSGILHVMDSSTEQVLKFNSSAVLQGAFGQSGGHKTGTPAVEDDKFFFSFAPGTTGNWQSYIAFDWSDDSFWMNDLGNLRNLQFDSSYVLQDVIQYLPVCYVIAVDKSDPTRVFARFLEFEVDYGIPDTRVCWTLKYNWGSGLDPNEWLYGTTQTGFLEVITDSSSGRTLAVAPATIGGVSDRYIFELIETPTPQADLKSTLLTNTGTTYWTSENIHRDMAIRYDDVTGGGFKIYEKEFTGFNGADEPTWSAATLVGEITSVAADDPYRANVPTIVGALPHYRVTDDGLKIICYRPSAYSASAARYHLGAIPYGGTGWSYRVMPSGKWTLAGTDIRDITKDGRFDDVTSQNYTGNKMTYESGHIVCGHHGEGWNNSQTNQFIHFHENGLFIGQFGVPSLARTWNSNPPGTGGNSYISELVTASGDIYFYHSEESAHGGVQRWKFNNVDSLAIYEVALPNS